jgi:hypothetical protein
MNVRRRFIVAPMRVEKEGIACGGSAPDGAPQPDCDATLTTTV